MVFVVRAMFTSCYRVLPRQCFIDGLSINPQGAALPDFTKPRSTEQAPVLHGSRNASQPLAVLIASFFARCASQASTPTGTSLVASPAWFYACGSPGRASVGSPA